VVVANRPANLVGSTVRIGVTSGSTFSIELQGMVQHTTD